MIEIIRVVEKLVGYGCVPLGVTLYDFDDALWIPVPLAINQRGRLSAPGRYAAMMNGCRSVVAGNAYLAEYARKSNADVHVIPTPYRDLGGRRTGQTPQPVPVIVWIGNVGNHEYLELLREPLTRLAREHDFVFRVIGDGDAAGFRPEGNS